MQDNIFDKVFRGVYKKEIHDGFEKLQKQYFRLLGKYNQQKGLFAEYAILNLVRYQSQKNNDLLKSVTRNLPGDFKFCEYSRVWRYDGVVEFGAPFNVDIYARAQSPADYSISGEIKNRDRKKFTREEAIAFMEKYTVLKSSEKLDRVIPFIFSRPGFTGEAESYCQANNMAWSLDEHWLGL